MIDPTAAIDALDQLAGAAIRLSAELRLHRDGARQITTVVDAVTIEALNETLMAAMTAAGRDVSALGHAWKAQLRALRDTRGN